MLTKILKDKRKRENIKRKKITCKHQSQPQVHVTTSSNQLLIAIRDRLYIFSTSTLFLPICAYSIH